MASVSVAGVLAFARRPTDRLMSGYIEAVCCGGTHLTSDDLVRANGTDRFPQPTRATQGSPSSCTAVRLPDLAGYEDA